jgi:hypothetical protein
VRRNSSASATIKWNNADAATGAIILSRGRLRTSNRARESRGPRDEGSGRLKRSGSVRMRRGSRRRGLLPCAAK